MPDINAIQSIFATNPRLKALLQQVIKGMGGLVPGPRTSTEPLYTPRYDPPYTPVPDEPWYARDRRLGQDLLRGGTNAPPDLTYIHPRSRQQQGEQRGSTVPQVRQLRRGGRGRAPSPEVKHRLSMGPMGGSRVLSGPDMTGVGGTMMGALAPPPEPAKPFTHPTGAEGLSGDITPLLSGEGFSHGPQSPYANQLRAERDRAIQAKMNEMQIQQTGKESIEQIKAGGLIGAAEARAQGQIGAVQAGLPAKEQAAQDAMDRAIIQSLRSDYGPEYLTAENIQKIKDALKKKKKKEGEGGEGGNGGEGGE